jgi:DNA-binding response OmpR family regulator
MHGGKAKNDCVLLVHDDPAIMETMAAALERAGYNVSQITDTDAA